MQVLASCHPAALVPKKRGSGILDAFGKTWRRMMTEELSPVGRFETILLATDGSEFSAAAETIAVELARRCGAHLLVTRVVLTNPEYEALVPDRVQKAEDDAQGQIDRVAETAKAGGVRAETVLRHGADPYHEVVRVADEKHADVVVIGRRNRSDLARLMVGDSTAKVIGLASCSVLVVPRDTRMPEKGVLVATDGSRLGDAAAYSAVRLVGKCNLPLTAVSIVPEDSASDERSEAQAAVERVRNAAAKEQINVEAILREGGRPDTVILDTARAEGADMIVVGSHGRTGLSRLMMGSVSERVIGNADCPVLVVKASV
jgi:nucleotide-binding universal stress UspA family protein